MKRILPVLLFLFSVSLSAAETTGYRIVHPDGTVEFTDDASRGGEEIKLRDVQTVDATDNEYESHLRQEKKPRKAETNASAYRSLNITSPHPEQTIWSAGVSLSVSVTIDPPLQSGHALVVSLDGSEKARGISASLAIADVYPGTHSVSVAVADQQGNTLISSPTVTFYLHRHKVAPKPTPPPTL